jgi:hypothetical protein
VSRRILAEQGGQRLREVAGGDALQIQDRQQRLDRLRAAHVGRQDRGREADAGGIVGGRRTVAHARLPDGDGTDAGHHLGQMAVANQPLAASLRLQIGMAGEELGDLGLDRLRQQATRPNAQDLGEAESDAQRYRWTRHIAPSVEK